MRILHVLSTPRAEGTPNLVLDWLTVPGHTQEIFVLNSTPADLTSELQERSNWYGESDLFRERGFGKLMRVARQVRQVCRDRRPDLVISWPTGMANWVCLGARQALGRNVRLLAHCGNPPNHGPRANWISRSVLWPLWLLGARCVCCSNYVRNLYRSIPGIPDSLFVTVYNCVDGARIKARAEASRARETRLNDKGGPVALMVATMERHKDHATLLRAIPAVLSKQPGFQLWLIGDGSVRSSLETLCRELKVEAAVRFLGTQKAVPDWLGRADLFVFSTTMQEGLGSALLEALAAGLPVVATDCPACRETLAGGEFGVLVDPGDSEALAKGILDQLTAKGGGLRGPRFAYAARFTPKRMMREYLELTS